MSMYSTAIGPHALNAHHRNHSLMALKHWCLFVSPFSRQTLHCNGANEEEVLVVEAKVLVHCSVEEGLIDEDAAPFSSEFVMESRGRNQVGNGVVPLGPPLDYVP